MSKDGRVEIAYFLKMHSCASRTATIEMNWSANEYISLSALEQLKLGIFSPCETTVYQAVGNKVSLASVTLYLLFHSSIKNTCLYFVEPV